ncbi:phage regulatory CII family protein [Nevskia sp.]|uniref:phage regulatory CII family protein n=1 Tax=Nevskia sp. TaxID=1929292 RepID=UPI003F71121E
MKGTLRTAIYLTVHEFPARAGHNAVESAALAIGRAPGTVYNKAAPESEQGFTLAEALALMTASGDYRILHALAQACGHSLVALGDYRRTSDIELLDLLLMQSRAEGTRSDKIRSALADGRVTLAEISDIRDAVHAHVRSELELLQRMEGLAHG